jgi:hypothetical protein
MIPVEVIDMGCWGKDALFFAAEGNAPMAGLCARLAAHHAINYFGWREA